MATHTRVKQQAPALVNTISHKANTANSVCLSLSVDFASTTPNHYSM